MAWEYSTPTFIYVKLIVSLDVFIPIPNWCRLNETIDSVVYFVWVKAHIKLNCGLLAFDSFFFFLTGIQRPRWIYLLGVGWLCKSYLATLDYRIMEIKNNRENEGKAGERGMKYQSILILNQFVGLLDLGKRWIDGKDGFLCLLLSDLIFNRKTPFKSSKNVFTLNTSLNLLILIP